MLSSADALVDNLVGRIHVAQKPVVRILTVARHWGSIDLLITVRGTPTVRGWTASLLCPMGRNGFCAAEAVALALMMPLDEPTVGFVV